MSIRLVAVDEHVLLRLGLASVLAAMVLEDYGQEPGPIIMARAGRFITTISQRDASQRREVDYEYM